MVFGGFAPGPDCGGIASISQLLSLYVVCQKIVVIEKIKIPGLIFEAKEDENLLSLIGCRSTSGRQTSILNSTPPTSPLTLPERN